MSGGGYCTTCGAWTVDMRSGQCRNKLCADYVSQAPSRASDGYWCDYCGAPLDIDGACSSSSCATHKGVPAWGATAYDDYDAWDDADLPTATNASWSKQRTVGNPFKERAECRKYANDWWL